MGDNILEAINEAVDALSGLTDAINAQQGGNTVVPICCEDIPEYYANPESDIEEGEGDPPDPYVTWEEWREDKCKRAWTAVLGVETALYDIYDKQEIGVVFLHFSFIIPWVISFYIVSELVRKSSLLICSSINLT